LLGFCFSYFGTKYWTGMGIVFAMLVLGMWLAQLAKQTMPMSRTFIDHVLIGWMIACALSMCAIAPPRNNAPATLPTHHDPHSCAKMKTGG
jgi:hypothetical protein